MQHMKEPGKRNNGGFGGSKKQKSASSALPAHLLRRRLLPPLTISTGEYKVSWGKLKVSRLVGLLHSPRARHSKPKMASLCFWWPSEDSCHVIMVEPPVSCLESTVPIAACEIAVSVRSAGCAYFASRGGTSLRSPSAFYAISSELPPLWQGKGLLETS